MLLWPLLLVVAILITANDGRPVLFLQERVGYQGKHFRILKFRTMLVSGEMGAVPLTVGRDPRITRVGAWLRKTNLDELPQLINVVLGQLSLVGPRPEVPRYVALYPPEQRRVLDLMPGITDLASIRYRDESELLGAATDAERTYIERIMPEKIRLNLEYAARATVWSDLVVILKTVGILFHPRKPSVA